MCKKYFMCTRNQTSPSLAKESLQTTSINVLASCLGPIGAHDHVIGSFGWIKKSIIRAKISTVTTLPGSLSP